MSRTSSKVATAGWESVEVRMRPNIEPTTHGDSPAWKGLQGVDCRWGNLLSDRPPGGIPLHLHGKIVPKALTPWRIRMP